MTPRQMLNRVMLAGIALGILLYVLITYVHAPTLTVLLNGAFVGAMVGIAVAYWKLLVNSFLGIHPYNRVQQMTLGFFVCWLALNCFILTSVYLRTVDIPVNSPAFANVGRFLGIIAAVLQVTAPDFGLGVFHGRDRKMLWTALIAGTIVAGGVILMQSPEFFGPTAVDAVEALTK